MNKPTNIRLIAFGGTAVIEFLAAAVIQLRLLPFLREGTVKIGRAGSPIPVDQFVAWAVPILVALGCLSVFVGAYLVISDRRKAE